NDPAMDVAPAGMPLEFSLSQNYPNPFNPATRIEYSIGKETKVKLEVFDLLGRSVVTLVDGPQHAGQHFVDFNASHLASGFYIYRLSSPDLTVAKKMMLVK
ncbi:T9SS C-terminal target domain-containing protein, partial [bacterium]